MHLEDLVLHDAGADVRAPTHELTIARDVLRSRRRIASQPPAWALSPDGLRTLRHTRPAGRAWSGPSLGDDCESQREAIDGDPHGGEEGEHANGHDASASANAVDPEARVFADIDAIIARSSAAIEEAKRPSRAGASGRATDTKALVYDLDWDEDARLDVWRDIVRQAQDLPPVLAAIVALDAWNELSVSQHAPWLGRLLAAALLRQGGIATGSHLVAINVGLKTIAIDRRRHRDRDTRLLAIAQGILAGAEIGLKEHDRLALARTDGAEDRGTANVVKVAGAGRAGAGATAGVIRRGGENAGGDAAGGAADRDGARASRDDRAGEVSGMGSSVGLPVYIVGGKSDLRANNNARSSIDDTISPRSLTFHTTDSVKTVFDGFFIDQ